MCGGQTAAVTGCIDPGGAEHPPAQVVQHAVGQGFFCLLDHGTQIIGKVVRLGIGWIIQICGPGRCGKDHGKPEIRKAGFDAKEQAKEMEAFYRTGKGDGLWNR